MIYLLFALGFSVLFILFLEKWQSRAEDFTVLSLNQAKAALFCQVDKKELDRQLSLLLSRGWSPQTLAQVYLAEIRDEVSPDGLQSCWSEVSCLGSPLFRRMWELEKNYSPARRRLVIALSLFDLPVDWSGQEEKLAQQVERTYHLAPDDDFWRDLADTVSQTFPNRQMSQKSDELARQAHQLRYVLSLQQSLWLRANYGGEGRTDRQSLQTYLSQSGVAYSSRESARLHNKTRKGVEDYPDNLKILVNFHSEFILDRSGNFLNILDGTEEGLVNGASFNYARRSDRRHWELDVFPVSKHDPSNRRRCLRSYRSPQKKSLTRSTAQRQLGRKFDRGVRNYSAS